MTGTADKTRRFDRLAGAAATLLAIVACYGTTLVIAALSLLGISMVIHEGAWTGVISFLALLASAGVPLS